jgi:acetyl esterase/lipase
LTPESAELLVDRPDGARAGGVVIAFSSLGPPDGPPIFEFGNSTADLPVARIFVRDLRRAWYHRGIDGLGNTVLDCAAALARLCCDLGARRVVTLGASMGGYAALLYGALIRADSVLAFSPQTSIDPAFRDACGDARWCEQLAEVHADPRAATACFDLTAVYGGSHRPRSAQIHVAPCDELDALHSRRLAPG